MPWTLIHSCWAPKGKAMASVRPCCQFYVCSLSDGNDFIKLLIQVSKKNGRKCISEYLQVTHSGTIWKIYIIFISK